MQIILAFSIIFLLLCYICEENQKTAAKRLRTAISSAVTGVVRAIQLP